ncbi:GAF domain-containing protein [Deinococcus maricopensis]|uniref:GAF domain protein n=1 Tax=Deinococcus maricopensis (strain DSM 21211 / LMG 22137 / NRRL B-23946 / LB-34) TaxID=709986 RepID=E8U4V1_DEIML|nr:GAF domain-containing protein [Deinococcus maricopensis]ADV66090.1 GAF domain protein [Deinococcus maricopensis DSM 21211]
MTAAPLPADEYARLLTLARYQILDTLPEPGFDRITRLAAAILRVPVALINFVDADRQWGKALVGLQDSEAPRQDSFCAWAILNPEPLIVRDALQDARFVDNPMVRGEPHVRLYAGVPLITPAGHRVGTLCVTDTAPRDLQPNEVQALQDLAALTVEMLELRLQALTHQALQTRAQQQEDLERTAQHADTLEAVNALMTFPLTPEEATLTSVALIGEMVDADWTALLSLRGAQRTAQAVHHRPKADAAFLEAVVSLTEWPVNLGGGAVYVDRTGTAHASALPVSVGDAVWLPLGTFGDVTYALVGARSPLNPVQQWRPSDRALLEAAASAVRAALARRAPPGN